MGDISENSDYNVDLNGEIYPNINNIQNLLGSQEFEDLYNNYSKISRRRIFFDLSHEQIFSPFDTGYLGMSELNILCQSYGLEVCLITTSILNHINNMTSNDIIFLNEAKYGIYSQNEIDNITNFVSNGGKLIVLGEHNTLGFQQFQNPLLLNFGIQLTTEAITDPIHNVTWPPWIVINSSFFCVQNISLMQTSRLSLSGSAFSIANSSLTATPANVPVIAGYNNSNGGKVFVVCDTECFWNGNKSYGGIHYGNNSLLMLRALDWFYNNSLSSQLNKIRIEPEFSMFTCSPNTNFTLNITNNEIFNVSTSITGGKIYPTEILNLNGIYSWQINVSENGFIHFRFKNSSSNIEINRTVYFFAGDGSKQLLFFEGNYSRSINAAPQGLMKFALDLLNKDYLIFASSKSDEFNEYDAIFLMNPLSNYSDIDVTRIQTANSIGVKIVMMNIPYSDVSINDPMAQFWPIYFGDKPANPPINKMGQEFGINFTHYLLCDSTNNKGKIYFPEIIGYNSTFYNLSCYQPAIVNASSLYNIELLGYNYSWGEDRSIFGLSGSMGYDGYDITSTSVLIHNDTILAAGILNSFINEYYLSNNLYTEFICNWFETGKFSSKYQLDCNVTDFGNRNIHFKLSTFQPIRDINYIIVPDGTLFTVYATLGEILDQDCSPSIEGHQIQSWGGHLNVNFSNVEDNGKFRVCIYNTTSSFIILSDFETFTFDNTPYPKISIFNPVNNSYWCNPPSLLVHAYDEGLDTIWYNITGNSSIFILKNDVSTPIDYYAWNLLPQGLFKVQIFANDTAGHINKTNVLYLYKDSDAPMVDIITSINNTYHNNPPNIRVIVLDNLVLDDIWYEIGTDKRDLTNDISEQIDPEIWNLLSDGEIIIKIYANDTAGNLNDSYVLKIFKDTETPQIIIILPQNCSVHGQEPAIHLIIYENIKIDTIWYQVGAQKHTLNNNTELIIDSTLWNGLPEGIFVLYLYANDSAGNINSTYTLKLTKDTSSPVINYVLPTDNSYFSNPPNLICSVTELSLDEIWFDVVGYSTNNTIYNETNHILDENLWNEIDEGIFYIKYNVNDTLGHYTSYIITLFKDSIKPEIILSSIGNYSYYIDPPVINMTFIESHPEDTWFTIDNSPTKYFISNNTNFPISDMIWNGLADGVITFYFHMNDSASNYLDFYCIKINKDTQAPLITINSPHNQDKFGTNAPDFSITVLDLNIDAVWYTLCYPNCNAVNNSISILFGTLNETLWDLLPEGIYTLRFYANDTLGQESYEEISIEKLFTDLEPDLIDPIILVIIIGSISLVGLVIIIKIKKRKTEDKPLESLG